MGVSFGYFRFQSAMLLFQLCEMRVNRRPNPPFLMRPGSSLDQTSHQAAVCHVGPQSRVCLTTGKQVYADLCEVLHCQHTRSQTRREPIEVRKATAGEHPACEPASSPRLFALRLGPLDHVHMPAVDALKQQDRWESVVEPGQLPGELHARRATTTDQPRLWLVIHVRIIGVRECRHGTGNIVRRASVEATSVVGDRARVRRFPRIRSLRISGRPAQTAAALAGACGQAASHPRIGGTG